ncbi:hypothetical protein RS694_01700 [Rhodoferax saidenbachensis]|uniref:DNA methyltransferase n=1 Tax=Rhodoferax saidenbachensis TaxID=1484693 RepID=A0A1P8K5W6_9BURK|nr:hypothetical protein RS694_01700 [Rhodoferax saidenbachensis]
MGESQAQFGKRFEVSQITVGYWESGRSQPARQRLAELISLDSSAPSVIPPTSVAQPFRPIQYLGSKQRLAESIGVLINEIAPGMSRVGDLFSGSGVVSALLAAQRPVTAVDKQVYSSVLSSALLQGRAEHFSALIGQEFKARAEEIASEIARSLAPLLALEEEAMVAAAGGRPELLIELIEFGSIAVHAQRVPENASPRLVKSLGDAARNLDRSAFTAADLTATRYFGGPYFSYKQAIALDAIFVATNALPAAPIALAVLLSVASEIVNTVGKQFAQPMKLKKADGTVPSLLLQRALRDRSLDVFETYKDWASRWMTSVPAECFEHRIVRGDVLDFVDGDSSCQAWYADPPYTIDHYSRFYHVLETLSLRDSPRLDEMNKRGEAAVMRGVYRTGRYQSSFCIPSQAPVAFNRLFSATAKRGTPLVLSYSPFDEEKGHRPRLLTLKEMVQTAKRHYRRVTVMEISAHSHRKLNAKSLNTSVRGDAERLILCEA